MKFRAALAMALALALSAGGALAQVRTTGNVNLRSGPGLNCEIVGSVEAEAELEYLGETRTDARGVDWYLVAYDGGESWISSRYAELSADAAAPAYDAEAAKDWVELSDYYLCDLQESAVELGLTHYEEVSSEAPYQYSNDAVTIASYQVIEYMEVRGPGYTLFGAACGMPISEARANMEAAGLQFYRDAGYCMEFQHPADERSLINAGGYDSNLLVEYSGDVVTGIFWSSYTG